MTARVSAACVLAVLCATGATASPLSGREAGALRQAIGEAVNGDRWRNVPDLMEQLAESDDKNVFKWMVQVAEQAPAEFAQDVAAPLRLMALNNADDRQVRREVDRAVERSDSPFVRRQLLVFLANQGEWEIVVEALDDRDEGVASIAVWRLVEGRVEEGVEPMIARMEELDRSQDGIWDVLQNGLAQLLGRRCYAGVEYRSLWQIVQDEGGLASVEPERGAEPEAGGMRSGVRLFGREIQSTRVVFILDVSGSMEAIDPNQHDYDAGPTVARGGGASGNRPAGRTRLERAQLALKRVIEGLPDHYKINIVAYSSRVRIWRGEEERRGEFLPPTLHELNASNRQSAAEFVDGFQAEGVTVTDEAIERAFDVEGARAFYLLSDGIPTRDGTTPIPTQTILDLIDDHLGEDRRVQIHTMGFREADEAFMRAVAEHTGGEYSDIR